MIGCALEPSVRRRGVVLSAFFCLFWICLSVAPFLFRMEKPVAVESHEANFAYAPLLLSLQVHHGGFQSMTPVLPTVRHFLSRKAEPLGTSLAMIPMFLLVGKDPRALRAVNLFIFLIAATLVFYLGLSASRPECGFFHAGTFAVVIFGASPAMVFAAVSGEIPQETYALLPGLVAAIVLFRRPKHRRAGLVFLTGVLLGSLFLFRFHLALALLATTLAVIFLADRRSARERLKETGVLLLPVAAFFTVSLLLEDGAHTFLYLFQDRTSDFDGAAQANGLWFGVKTGMANLVGGAPFQLLAYSIGSGVVSPIEDFQTSFSPGVLIGVGVTLGLIAALFVRGRGVWFARFTWAYLGVTTVAAAWFFERSTDAVVHVFFHVWPPVCVVAGIGLAALFSSVSRRLNSRRGVWQGSLVVTFALGIQLPLWVGAVSLPCPFCENGHRGFQHWAIEEMQPHFLGNGVVLITNDRTRFGKIHHAGYFEWLMLPDGRFPHPPHAADSFFLVSNRRELDEVGRLAARGFERLFVVVDPFVDHVDPNPDSDVWDMDPVSLLGYSHPAWRLEQSYTLTRWKIEVKEFVPLLAPVDAVPPRTGSPDKPHREEPAATVTPRHSPS